MICSHGFQPFIGDFHIQWSGILFASHHLRDSPLALLVLNRRITLQYSQFQSTNLYWFTVIVVYVSQPIYSPPARWGLLDFIRAHARPPPLPPPPRLAVLLALLLASASSTSTSALPTLPTRRQAKRFANFPAQCALLDLNLRAAQLSVHRWTSTCELPSSVCIAGPQPGTCPAQCAPLDLNRGPSQLSVHRWTSTGDLPSSVCTAGPQPGTCPAQCAPLDLNLGPAQLSVHRWTPTAR